MERLYTLRDACDIMQIDPGTLRKWDREGKIRCVRLQNNFRRIPESEINRILGIQKERSSYIYARSFKNPLRSNLIPLLISEITSDSGEETLSFSICLSRSPFCPPDETLA